MDVAPAASDPWTEPSSEGDRPYPAGSAPGAGRRAWPAHRLPRPRSARWAAALAWLVPGLGHAFVGRPGAGLVLLLVLCATFAGGLALTDFSCVDPHAYQLEFVAHALIGGPTGLALELTRGVRLERMPPWIEVGRLFVVVAGFLNLVALCDAVGEAWRRNARIAALRARQVARATTSALEPAPLARADEPAPAQAVPAARAEAAQGSPFPEAGPLGATNGAQTAPPAPPPEGAP